LGTSDCFSVLGFGRTINVGLRKQQSATQTICSTVWEDENSNNIIDLGERLLPDLTVEVYSCAGVLLGSFISGSTDEVCLDNLESVDYYLRLATPAGYLPNTAGAITNEYGSGTTTCYSGTNTTTTINLGLTPTEEETQLDVTLWEDTNENGIQDAGEFPMTDIRVTLYTCTGTLIDETFSEADGTVSFDGLSLGQYYVQTELVPGLEFLNGGVITNAFGPGSSTCFDLGTGTNSIDIFYVPMTSALTADISGKVWLDGNEDGVMDLTELGMAAVDVRLYDENFVPLELTSTNDDGEYTFRDLDFGSYYVQFLTPDNYVFTDYRVGSNASTDSEVIDPVLGMTDIVVLATASGMYDVNAGLVESIEESSRVSGRIWIDENRNGIIDLNEPGWAESLVDLYDETGDYHSSTYSDVDGNYFFPVLPVGNYYISFDLPSGYNYTTAKVGGVSEHDSEVVDLIAGTTSVFELQSASGLSGINAGLQRIEEETVSVSGKVWIDADNNNLLGNGEDGFSDLLVILYDANGNNQFSTFTESDGSYSFLQLDAGQYYLDFELPSGYNFSIAQVSNNDLDSEVVDILEGTTPIYDLQPGDNLTDVHVGLQEIIRTEPASISGRVWIDADVNDLDDGYANNTAR